MTAARASRNRYAARCSTWRARRATSSRPGGTSRRSRALVAGHETLARVLANPGDSGARKARVRRRSCSRAPADVSPIVPKLLLVLAERDRLVLLPELATRVTERG